MQLITFLFRSAGVWLIVALVASLLSGLANASLLAIINQALTASEAQRLTLAWQFALAGAAMLLTRTLSQGLFMSMGQRAKARLRLKTIHRIANARYPDLEQQGVPKAMAVLTQDLDQIVVFFVTLPGLLSYIAVISGCLLYLGWLSLPVMLIALAAIALGSVGYLAVNRKAMGFLKGSRLREDGLLRHFGALFSGAKELRLHRARRQSFLRDELETTIEQVRAERTRGYVLYALANIWGSFFFFTFIGGVLFLLSRVISLPLPVMTGFSMIFLYMIVPVEAALSSLPAIGMARVALDRIDAVMRALPPESSAPQTEVLPLESVVLENVIHHYFNDQQQQHFQLGPVNLTFGRGELVYLIGGNGSGKTTLAKLLAGLYPPESGDILLNGVRTGDHNRDAYRQHFSSVFSDFHLFDSLHGLPAQGLDDRAKTLLEALQLQHKVTLSEGRFSTLSLSSGQRKRLALLVAYLEDRDFYLFDEWAADQDPEFKNVFYQHLLPALKQQGKTVLVITHDDRYFHLADRCIRLDYGQIVADSAPEPVR